MILNINEEVKVKSTKKGLLALMERQNKVLEEIPFSNKKTIEDFEKKLDKDGYYSIQLWYLFETFSQDLQICHEFFDLNIII